MGNIGPDEALRDYIHGHFFQNQAFGKPGICAPLINQVDFRAGEPAFTLFRPALQYTHDALDKQTGKCVLSGLRAQAGP